MYQYKAKLVRVVDGDTVDAMVDLGFDTWVKKRIRLAGIDAYECRTRDKEEKKKGIRAKERLIEVLGDTTNEFYLKSSGVDKYGRCLGEMSTIKSYIRSSKYHGKSINELLVKEGHATRYVG
jgi:micrococcal nuclease